MSYSKDHPVYLRLKHAIIVGEILPGMHLKLGELSQRLGTSTAPLREALTRLASEDLVHYDFSHGYSVREMSFSELSDVVDLIELILVDGLKRLENGFSNEFLDRAAGLIDVAINGPEGNSLTQNNLQAIINGCRVLLCPAADRQLIKLSTLTLPFQTKSDTHGSCRSANKPLIQQLLLGLKSGDATTACSAVQELFADIRSELPSAYRSYEQRCRMNRMIVESI